MHEFYQNFNKINLSKKIKKKRVTETQKSERLTSIFVGKIRRKEKMRVTCKLELMNFYFRLRFA